MARRAIVLFTRDLRLHDHPALAWAHHQAEEVIPLFVVDPRMPVGAGNRPAYLRGCLEDLRAGLRRAGGDLVVRRGDPTDEVVRLAQEVSAEVVVLSRDASGYATDRAGRLARAGHDQRIGLHLVDAHHVVAPGELAPTGGDHYKVFTPYWRAWSTSHWRQAQPAPRRIRLPDGVDPGSVELVAGSPTAAGLPDAGEGAARKRMTRWLDRGIGGYEAGHDDLAGDLTSRLSADLHFGALSALELAVRARGEPGDEGAAGREAFVRQLCWRDFHAQVAAAFPDLGRRDYRPRPGRQWRDDPEALDAWKAGETGWPVVDAGMRQLAAEGFMHNRARLLTASFLTKDLGIHWTAGADHFLDLLVDGDLANNSGNWQWVAGTGNDPRPNRSFNLLRQARRFDPDGDYVRRYVPELASVAGPAVHEPWKLDRPPRYPARLAGPGSPEEPAKRTGPSDDQARLPGLG